MKFYSANTLKNWTKNELIEYIECLQNNLAREENLSDHMYSTITAVMKKIQHFQKRLEKCLTFGTKTTGIDTRR